MLLHNRILDTQTKWYKGWWTNGYRDLLVNLIQNQIRSWVGVTMNFFRASGAPGAPEHLLLDLSIDVDKAKIKKQMTKFGKNYPYKQYTF